MIGLKKVIAGTVILGACMACLGIRANAATGIYVGKDVSAEGTTLLGVSTEVNLGTTTVPVIIEKGTIKKGDVIESDNGYKYTMPEDNAKMTFVHLMSYMGYGEWGSMASNEYGVTVATAITTDPNLDAITADPFVSDGISEQNIAKIVASTSKTAREAVTLLCSILDEAGAASAEIVMIADPDGAWVVENYTGHQYVATKLPDDKMAAFSNEPVIKTADADDADTICSADLFTLPEKNDFAIYDENKNLDLILTYNSGNTYSDEPHIRAWVGHDIFAASQELDYDAKEGFDVFFTPDEKVSVTQAFDFFRNRYEGTEFDLVDDDNEYYWGINNQTVGNVTVAQIFDDVPAPESTVLWTTPANPTASPFIPIPVLADTIPGVFSTDIEDDSFADDVLQFYFVILNNNVVPRRNLYGASIRQYWQGMEAVCADDIAECVRGEWMDAYDTSASVAISDINDYIGKIVSAADDNCRRLTDELEWYQFRNGIIKSSVPDEELVPFECSFDAVTCAHNNGWETSIDGDVFTATKDGKTIEVVFDGEDKGNITFTGFDNKNLAEDFEADADIDENGYDDAEAEDETDELIDEAAEEVEATVAEEKEETKDEKAEEKAEDAADDEITEAVAQKAEVDTIAALEEYFGEKIASVPRNGWAENEIASELSSVSGDVADIILKYFNVKIDSIEDIQNIDKQIDYEGLANDPKAAEVANKLAATGTDLAGLLENYFTAVAEDVNEDIVSGRLSQDGAVKILNEAETDVEAFVKLYIEGVFGQVFDTDLSPQEFSEIISELGVGAAQVMEDYGMLNLADYGLGDMTVKDLTEADIDVVITLSEMDDDVIDGLSALLGVDVRATLDMYMKQINDSTPDNFRIVEENHELEEADAAPEDEVKAVMELEESLKEEDIEIPQEVIDILNEAIREAQAGGTYDDEPASTESYTINVGNVRNIDGKIMLPAFMLKYFN